MGTKNNPGKFDCYAKAEPDEPMFVLLARDPFAPFVVELWRQLHMWMVGREGVAGDKSDEARRCILAMEKWAVEHGVDHTLARMAFQKFVRSERFEP